MLKQILRDMYVDPEILAGLDETYKQILFCKMREEQIRRWKIWDEEQQKNEKNLLKNHHFNENYENTKINHIKLQKHVSFRLGEDGEPWVWVMGEHPDDLTIEQILEEEAKQKARQLAENEFRHQQQKNENTELTTTTTTITPPSSPLSSSSPLAVISPITASETITIIPKIEDYEIYCSVDEIKNFHNNAKNCNNNYNNNNNMKSTSTIITQSSLTNFKQLQNHYNNNLSNNSNNHKNNSNNNNFKNDTNKIIDVLQEISYNKPPTSSIQKVSARIALWEQRTIGQRTSEIFKQIQKQKQEVEKEAEEAAKHEEELWKEQERKAKQAELQMREVARRAREEHRKSLNCEEQQQQQQQQITTNLQNNENTSINNNNHNSSPLNSLDLSIPSRPPNSDAVINWYRTIEFPKKCGINLLTNKPEKWFHGYITRTDAENLLLNEDNGTFLIRLSEKIWGYAISYKDVDRCKHYLIDASNSKYKFIGQNQLEHDSLSDLLRHHASVPITILGNELLIRPCPSTVTIPSVLKDLL